MSTIREKYGANTYEAEYFIDEGLVTVIGDRGQESTQLDGLSEEQVIKHLLISLIRKNHIDPIKSKES